MIILHVLKDSVPYAKAGYAIRSHAILDHQQEMGMEVYGMTLPGFPSEDGPIIRDETIDGVQYIRASKANLAYRLKRKLGHHLRLPQLSEGRNYRALLEEVMKRVVRRIEPDIIHIHSLRSEALGAVDIAKGFNIPVVYELRGLWEESEVAEGVNDRGSGRFSERREAETEVMRSADHIVTICEELKKEILTRGISEDKVSVVSNGVDVRKFDAMPRDSELASRLSIDDRFVIGYISSLRKLEGVETILRAVPLIRKQGVRVKALIVGDGPELQTLKNLAKESDISGDVVLTGNVPHSQIKQYYSVIDGFVVPRLDYQVCRMVTPLKPYEAMAMKKAVIVSDLPALREIITDNETGLTFEAGNHRDLADKVLTLVNNRPLRQKLEEAAYAFVRKNKDWRILVERYKDIYSGLL